MLQKAIEEARITMNKNIGGPFGALITDKDNNIIAISSNSVLKDNDPTAHAEINAIRKASSILKTNDLNGYKLYTTSYPCPMCISAIIWSNIKEVYYGAGVEVASKIGFRDDYIYDFIKKDCRDDSILKIRQLEEEQKECEKLFKEYVNNNKQLY